MGAFSSSMPAAIFDAGSGGSGDDLETRRAAAAERARQRRVTAELLGESQEPKATPEDPRRRSSGSRVGDLQRWLMEGELELLSDDATAWVRRFFALSSTGVLHSYAAEADARSSSRPLSTVPIAPPPGAVAGAAAVVEEGGWDEGRAVIEVRVRAPGPHRGRVLVLATPPAVRSTDGLGAGAKRLADRWVRALRAVTGGSGGR